MTTAPACQARAKGEPPETLPQAILRARAEPACSHAEVASPPEQRPQPRSTQSRRVRRNVAAQLDAWRARHRFYHERITEYLRFLIPPSESVMLFGCEDGALLDKLNPSRGLGLDDCDEMVRMARKRHPRYRFVATPGDPAESDETFAYVVLNDMTGEVDDLFTFLQRVATRCEPDGRVIIVQHNYLWRPLLRLAARLGLKRPDARQNWLSAGDLRVFLAGVGLETIDVRSKLFCPLSLLGFGSLINHVAGLIPWIRRLASTEIIVAKPVRGSMDADAKTATIVLTVRDERDNIEPMVRAIPSVGADMEILFVEGHSTDGTREEVARVIEAYPDRKIELLVQDGIGQGDAIRKGFAHARGDVIILLEADRTSPPEDVRKAFDVIAGGHADYVGGSRFIYPRQKDAMPRLNVMGNWCFAVWFTWFLGQRTSDVLCGIKAISRRHFHRLDRNWGFLGLFDPFGDFELIFGAARLGLKISEIPTRYRCRTYGQPKSKVFTHGMMLLRMAMRATRIFKCR